MKQDTNFIFINEIINFYKACSLLIQYLQYILTSFIHVFIITLHGDVLC